MGALVVIALALALALGPRPAQAAPSEAELKAEFIERFLRFVDWDEAALGTGDLVVCVVGDDPITPYLDRIARSRKLKNRKAVVIALPPDKPEKLSACKVVVIASVDKKRLTGILSHAGRGVLTIADAPGAAQAGTVINFYREDSHIKYEVNVGAAEDAGLILRAKLLRLARLVGEKRPR
ncbi:MAG: YfiR family protein [Deltaproteobacteria bacterium]|nr:YfiR family protein [Deltaproteobacteria bacterium]